MKKVFITLIFFLNIALLTGCYQKGNTLSKLSVDQQAAVKNSIEFIKGSSFTSKDRIDTNVIKIDNATDNTWKSVVSKSGNTQVKENVIDTTDWIITIGDTSDHDFAVIVCDSSTHEVIGYIPIK